MTRRMREWATRVAPLSGRFGDSAIRRFGDGDDDDDDERRYENAKMRRWEDVSIGAVSLPLPFVSFHMKIRAKAGAAAAGGRRRGGVTIIGD